MCVWTIEISTHIIQEHSKQSYKYHIRNQEQKQGHHIL